MDYIIAVLVIVFLGYLVFSDSDEVTVLNQQCQNYYGVDYQSVSPSPAKVIPHRGIKPNQVIITCGDKEND